MQSLPQARSTIETLPEERRVLVSVSRGAVDVLIAHEILPGDAGRMLNAVADSRMSKADPQRGKIGGAARAILPRIVGGLEFWIDGATIAPHLREIDVRPGAICQYGAGMVGLARFRLSLPDSPIELREIAITLQDGHSPVVVEFQCCGSLTTLECSCENEDESILLHPGGKVWTRIAGCELRGLDSSLD